MLIRASGENTTTEARKNGDTKLFSKISLNFRVSQIQCFSGQSWKKVSPMAQSVSVIISTDGKEYVALCPEFSIQSEGHSIDEAVTNLEMSLEDWMGLKFPEDIQFNFIGWKN